MSWNPERTALLKKLWQDGLSASQIARKLGGVSRNAVIGKVHRLGLHAPRITNSARPKQSTRAKPSPPRPLRVASKWPPRSEHAGTHSAPKPSAQRCAHDTSAAPLTFGAHMCQWPLGDPGVTGFAFCGRPSRDALPYCADHALIAYQPASAKTSTSALIRSLRRYL